MEINRNNYEAFFIDYLEDNLDKNSVDDFIEFLQQNPDLKEELAILGKVTAVAENISFNKKENLYKEKLDVDETFNQTVVANLEGDISAADKAGLNRFIEKHPEKKRELLLFSKTKLTPDKTIVFKNKKKLYRRSTTKTIVLWSVRIAAVFVLAFAFFTLFNSKTNPALPTNNLAKARKTEILKPSTTKKLLVKPESKTETKPEKKIIKKKNSIAPKKKKLVKHIQKEPTAKELEIVREPVEKFPEIKSITASINVNQPKLKMKTMHFTVPDNIDYSDDEILLADRIKEKVGFEKVELNKVVKAGLNLVSSISNNKFRYETNHDGKITKYNYESRLVAFSIPSKKTNPK